MARLILGAAALGVLAIAPACQPRARERAPAAPDPLTRLVERVGRDTAWRLEARVPLDFDAFHPQGLARVGQDWFLSTAEVLEKPTGGGPGRGRGHLIRFGRDGRKKQAIALGEGDAYHPGGIDFDGRHLWVPVAEYRPHSRTLVYRVDPATMAAEVVFRVDDHLGAIARDPRTGTLVAASWGGRTLYAFDARGRRLGRRPAPEGFVDAQDCQALGLSGQVVCGGVAAFGPARTQLGGLLVVDVARLRMQSEVRLDLTSQAGNVATHEAIWLEAAGDTLRLHAVPDDGRSALHVWVATP